MRTEEELRVERIRLKKFRRNLLRILCVVAAIFLCGWGASPFIKLGFNMTDSVDGYLFLVVKNEIPEKGELVAFWPGENEFYENIWFVKYLKGVPGDYVERQERSFFIDGESLGLAKVETTDGVPLIASSGGVIPFNNYFVWTPHERSFDSRYEQIGLVSESNIIGRAYRIF